MGCHCEVWSIGEGDCRDIGGEGGGREDAGREEGGAFSMSDVEGEGAGGLGDLGTVAGGSGEEVFC